MKGQIRIEFIFGIVIFILVIVMVVTQTNTLYSSLLGDSRKDALKAKAINVIDILVGDTGDPPNWDTLVQSKLGSVRRVGLAYQSYQPYNLSQSKILNLSQNCSGTTDAYKNLLWNFNLNAYRLKIYNSTGSQILFCGYDSLEPPAVMETRYVYIRGDFGKVTLELW